jgi:PTS system mannose-specific IIA component
MIGIIVASHGELAHELVRTAERVVGEIARCVAVSVDKFATADEMQAGFQAAVDRVDDGEGILILTDMFGGTPANLGLSLLSEGKVEVLTGVNLPMLLKLATSRAVPLSNGGSLGEMARLIKYYGQKNISVASEFLSQ